MQGTKDEIGLAYKIIGPLYRMAHKDRSNGIMYTLLVLLVLCQFVDAYTEDFSVTQYRVPGVSS